MSATRSTTHCARASCLRRTGQFVGYRVDKADSPAVDIQQAGGAFQRLTVAVLVFLGTLGAVAPLGFLSLAVILAQVEGPLRSTELIYCWDPDGPADPRGFARADHCDHIHVGWDA